MNPPVEEVEQALQRVAARTGRAVRFREGQTVPAFFQALEDLGYRIVKSPTPDSSVPPVTRGTEELVGWIQEQFGHERAFCLGHKPETGPVEKIFAVECEDLTCHRCGEVLAHEAYLKGWL